MIYLIEEIEGYGQRDLARMLLLYGLYQEYGIAEEIRIERSELGKPYLADFPQIHFNYSHSKQGILCGIDSAEIGVDIERRIPYKENLAKRICHPREWEMVCEAKDKPGIMTRIWTAKESYLKYRGTGIRSDMRKVDLSGCIHGRFQKEECFLQVILKENCGMAVCGTQEAYEFRSPSIGDVEAIAAKSFFKE